MTNCRYCACALTKYKPLLRQAEWFCACCESATVCPNDLDATHDMAVSDEWDEITLEIEYTGPTLAARAFVQASNASGATRRFISLEEAKAALGKTHGLLPHVEKALRAAGRANYAYTMYGIKKSHHM